MYCKIIPKNCIACGRCQVIAPETFDCDADGIVCFRLDAAAERENICPALLEKVGQAVRRCPAGALLLE